MVLSVIIPVFNGEKIVCKAVDSIREYNGMLDYEIILVDDGSEDNSYAVLQKCATQFPFIRIITKENGGIASARNAGLAIAKGEYIAFLDQDDLCISSYKPFLDQMKNENIEVLITDFFQSCEGVVYKTNIIREDVTLTDIEKCDYIRDLLGRNQLPLKIRDNIDPPNSIWNCIISKGLIDRAGLRFKRFVDYEDDWIFQVEMLLAADKAALSQKAFYCYTVNPDSESHRNKYIADFYNKRRLLIEWVEQCCKQSGLNDAEMNHFRALLQKRTILWSLYNESFREEGKPVNELSAILSHYDEHDLKWIRENCFFSKKEKNLFELMSGGKVNMALLLNRHFFKCRYH